MREHGAQQGSRGSGFLESPDLGALYSAIVAPVRGFFGFSAAYEIWFS